MLKSFKNNAFLTTLLLGLTGCGATLSQGTKIEDVAKSGEGIAITHVGFGFERCTGTTLTFGKWSEEHQGLKAGEMKQLTTFFSDNDAPLQLKLPQGEYKIVRITCSHNNRTLLVNAPNKNVGNILIPKQIYNRAIASFTVQTGEVVNIGALNLTTGFGMASSSIQVIPQAKLDKFAKVHPELSSKMITRPMQKPEADPERIAALANALRDLEKAECALYAKATDKSRLTTEIKKRCGL